MAFMHLRRTVATLSLGLMVGCIGDGAQPPTGRLHSPVAMEISPDGSHLLVVNGNFNLRYLSGSVQSYDLDAVNRELEMACGERPLAERDACGVVPQEDPRDDLTSGIRKVAGLLTSEVLVGSYGSEIRFSEDGARAYVSVRSNGSLTYLDVAGGNLSCGQGADRRCAESHEVGTDDVVQGEELPVDAVGLVTGRIEDLAEPGAMGELTGDYILMAHRQGAVSLFFDRATASDPAVSTETPRLIHVLTGLPGDLTGLRIDSRQRLAWLLNGSFSDISRVGVGIDPVNGNDSATFDAGRIRLSGIDTGSASRGNTRDMIFDERDGQAQAFVLARRPEALLTVGLDEDAGTLEVHGSVPVGAGASRLNVSTFDGHDGRTLAFVSCFDAGDIYVIDVDLGSLAGIVRNQGGPFGLKVDTTRERLYVLDFVSSVVRVIDLAPMFECLDDDSFDPRDMMERSDECSPQTLGVLGRPLVVRDLD